MYNYSRVPLLVLASILLLQTSWGFSFWSKKDGEKETKNNEANVKGLVGDFSMEAFNNKKGIELLENAKNKMLMNGCMQNAYQSVFASCSKIYAEHELKSKFAWYLSDCFEKSSGRPNFPQCDPQASMANCVKKLDDHAHGTYRTFYLEVNNLCHQLQNEAFRRRTESLVNDLKSSAEYAEEKLVNIGEQGEQLLHNSKNIQDSLATIDIRTQQVSETSKNIEEYINVVLRHSQDIYSQSKEIANSQGELREGQQRMKEKLEEGMTMVQDSYNNLGEEVNNIRNEAIEIEKEIGKVGEAMVSRMSILESKADDIEDMAGLSLDKQKELLDIQSVALQGVNSLTKFQSQALEESRSTLQQLADFGHKQQEELLQKQKHLQQAHDHLVENSKTILAAQEAFESKQETMFTSIDKLFALHNALLLESRLIKTFLYYSLAILVVYMFTSTKQTYNVRPMLYMGLCVTFLIESVMLRYTTYEMQGLDNIRWIRLSFVFLAAFKLLHSIITYRDYEVLNHQMLLTLIHKVNNIERSKTLSQEDESDEDSEVDWLSWVDEELPEDVDKLVDPDFVVHKEENTLIISPSRYNLRQRFY
ncbi:hypothetical protein LIER_29634 [Lithospermum erythrorhizon]|uniref:Protein GAMETE EXPRESSED 1 n=1 Tax=Lithospermum erythrorhizon TaxID=34254 RepID=A0AAV3RLK1_LITER